MNFAYALYRDDMKRVGLNPDCNIENDINNVEANNRGYKTNPYLSQCRNDNHHWLQGGQGGTNYYQSWKDKHALHIIGTGGCRSRAIPCTESEFATFELMLIAKADVVKTHQDWIGSIIRAVDLVGEQIKAMKHKSEVDILAKEYNWEPQISLNKVFGSALVVNPASVKSMTDSILGYERKPSKEEKIATAKIALQKHLESQQVA